MQTNLISTSILRSLPLLCLCLFLLTACGNDEAATQSDEAPPAATTTAAEAATEPSPSTTGAPESGAESTARTTTPEPPKVAAREATVIPKANQAPLTLAAANIRAKTGAEACVEVQVADFVKLLSMQYSLRWDPKLLRFKRVSNFQLPSLGPEDFGAHRSAEGILTAIWIDEHLKGVTVNNGTTIYQLCFDVLGRPGQTAKISFVDGPTIFEVSNLASELVELRGISGKVEIN